MQQCKTDREWLDKLDADFTRLQHNREKVPLDQLRTRYAKAYNALVVELGQDADWFAARYRECLAFPMHPEEKAGNDWLEKRIAAILEDEKKPGGRVERYRAALIDHMDRAEFEQLVFEIYDRLEREAFAPYWNRHCCWVGEAGKRWIYNDIFKKFWLPSCEQYPGGGWINNDYSGWDGRFPPHLKEE